MSESPAFEVRNAKPIHEFLAVRTKDLIPGSKKNARSSAVGQVGNLRPEQAGYQPAPPLEMSTGLRRRGQAGEAL
jgi:hypothetical protein